MEDPVTSGEMWEENSVKEKKERKREESEGDMKEERRSVRESRKENRRGQGWVRCCAKEHGRDGWGERNGGRLVKS